MQEEGIGAKKRSENRKRRARFELRLLPTERDEIAALAERAGLTIGSYMRSRALEKPTTQARRKPAVEQVAVSKLIGELARVGNNLNQLAKKANAGNFIAEEIRAALAVVQEIGKSAKDVMRNV
jgi:hypothetical protein